MNSDYYQSDGDDFDGYDAHAEEAEGLQTWLAHLLQWNEQDYNEVLFNHYIVDCSEDEYFIRKYLNTCRISSSYSK